MQKPILPALALIVLGGCAVQVRDGNGVEASETRTIEQAFDGVAATTNIEVAIEEGELLVEVTCDEDLLDEIETIVENGQLVVRTEQDVGWTSIRPHADCHVYVRAPELHEGVSTGSGRLVVAGESARIGQLTSTGSGGILAEATLTSPEIAIENTGSGGIEVAAVDADALFVTSSGSGATDLLAGAVQTLDLTITGSGSVSAADVSALDADATLTGSGSGFVTAEDSLSARITGSGSLHVAGDPDQRDVQEPGSGSVIFE